MGRETLRIHSHKQLNTHHMQAIAFGDDIPWCICRQGFLKCILKPKPCAVSYMHMHIYMHMHERERERENTHTQECKHYLQTQLCQQEPHLISATDWTWSRPACVLKWVAWAVNNCWSTCLFMCTVNLEKKHWMHKPSEPSSLQWPLQSRRMIRARGCKELHHLSLAWLFQRRGSCRILRGISRLSFSRLFRCHFWWADFCGDFQLALCPKLLWVTAHSLRHWRRLLVFWRPRL